MTRLSAWPIAIVLQFLSIFALLQDQLIAFLLTHLLSTIPIIYNTVSVDRDKRNNMLVAATIFTIFFPGMGALCGLMAFRLLEYIPRMGDPVTQELDSYVIAENEFTRRLQSRTKKHLEYAVQQANPWQAWVNPGIDAIHSNDTMTITNVIRTLFANPTFEACRLIRKLMYAGENAERYICLTTVSQMTKQWSDDIKSLNRCLDNDGGDTRIRYELAGTYLGIGKQQLLPEVVNSEYLESAFQHSRQLVEEDPQNIEILKLAAKAAILTHRYKEAIDILRSTDYTETNSFSYWFWLLECYFHVGDTKSIMAICEKFKKREIECPPKFRPHIHFWLTHAIEADLHQAAS